MIDDEEEEEDEDEPLLNDIFERSIAENGVSGDIAIGTGLQNLVGQVVTAKRLGWDDDGDNPDLAGFDEMDYDSPDLTGVLSSFPFTVPNGSSAVAWEVNGQPADPKTIRRSGREVG